MALRREEGWHSSHQSHFGRDRWEELRVALERDHEHLCYVNPFLPASEKEVICEDYSLQPSCIPGAYDFCLPPTERQFPVVDASDERHIFVDKLREERHEGSSLVVSAALQVEEGDTVLDACANGITSLVLAGGLFPRCPRGQALPHDLQGRLVCNEMVKSKASRLQQTMHTLLPWRLFDVNAAAGHAPRVVFTSVDMATTSNAAERLGPYDKILLGPPCTEDKEMLRGSAPGGLSKWSAATAKVNAERQLKWLTLWLLREGGVVLYFTRALSVEEGDGVIQRLFQRVEGLFDLQVMPLEELVAGFVPGLSAEPTDWGARIMPDKTSFGPMFFSRLRLLRRRHQGHEQATGFVSLGP